MKMLIMWQLGAQKLPATCVILYVIWSQFVKITTVTDVLGRDKLQKLSRFKAEQVESGYFFWESLIATDNQRVTVIQSLKVQIK